MEEDTKKFHKGDLVYLLDDVTYNKKKLKRGQEFIVVEQRMDIVECILEGVDEFYTFTSEFLTDNPSDVLWSKAFFRVLIDNIVIFVVFIVTLFLIFHLLISS